MKKISNRILVSLLISIIFIIDITIPPGTALAILYVIPMAITFSQSRKNIFFFAAVCSVLTVTDDVLYFNPGIEYSIYVDSFLAILAIWLSSFATIKYKQLKEKAEKQKEETTKAILEMLFMTSHRLREPICSIQGLNTILESRELSVTELQEISRFLNTSITKLDVSSRELTDFLTKIRLEKEMSDN